LNGLYVNVRGREAHGIVAPSDRDRLAAEIAAALLATTDPVTGAPAITKVYKRDQVYHLAGVDDIAPDLIVGYAKGTRNSDESALGDVPAELMANNLSAWSGDHCMDPDTVPGILLTSRRLQSNAATLQALPSAILAELGIHDFPHSGRN
jgi:predicted AlkP superfamily phosphohydrolase/phosphomutase